MINKYVYNFATKTLKVEFNGGSLYEYSNVESDLYDELCKSESTGKFFNEKIKNNYEHIQLLTD
jgi:lysyl-tRNA synthetase class 2